MQLAVGHSARLENRHMQHALHNRILKPTNTFSQPKQTKQTSKNYLNVKPNKLHLRENMKETVTKVGKANY